ncbi:MAG TPA: Gfo/Idh/MocA family oxidoreductase [Isosphaeraceae bacterium]|jgi:predicted dehydrogenase|nr:Gfo/Idh/MocA family oxidoreductase [Isosphaeraceae bacterium]
MKANDRLTRRDVLRRSAAGPLLAAPWIVPAAALGRGGKSAASERITLGVIGIGPRCTYDLQAMLQHKDVQCVAICDVQAGRREAGKALVDKHYGNADCKTYRDFHDLLARRDVDAVLIATGDRWHAPASILAARAGKDVYSEKPCGLTIAWCQALDDAIRETKRVFQAGTQRRNVANFQAAIKLAHSGKLGKLHTLYASVYTPEALTAWLPAEPTPARDVVDWDLWLGPAPWRPYNKAYVQGGWRGYWDFDSACRLMDWGAHTVDLCQWANKADDTMPVEYEPSATNVTARYANGVKLVLDFLKTPFAQRPGWVQSLGTCPVRFVGDEGSVEVGDSGGIEVQPSSLRSELKNLEGISGSGLDVGAHSRDFFDCVRSRRPPAANSSVMRHSHIAVHAAALSWLLNRKLRLDPSKEEFLDDPEANGLRSLPSRKVL